MQSATLRSSPASGATTLRGKPFTAARACPKARKPAAVTAAQAEDRSKAPARFASGLLAAVAAAQLTLTGAAQADVFDNAKQIFSPGDAKDIKEGKGQSPSDKYTQQAKQFASPEAADKIANSPDINVGGGSMGVGEFQAGNQAREGKGRDTYKDIRGGTPDNGPRLPGKAPGWMNVLDLSAAPIASPDAEADNDKKANLVKPGGFSNALVEAGKKVTGSLPNPPDASNPKGAQDVPTISKLAKANPVKDLSVADFTDNKPSFPAAPATKPEQDQDVFKQIGDALPKGPNLGGIGEAIAENAGGPDVKKAVGQTTSNLSENIQNTPVAPESIGAEANARNSKGNFNDPKQ